MKRIGITGNIGSGKTTVAGLFERLGIPVYYADAEAKKLMVTSPALRAAITERFGNDVYQPVGGDDFRLQRSKVFTTDSKRASEAASSNPPQSYQLNRKLLAERAFSDPAALADLNAIVHPAVAAHALEWHQAQQAPYTLHEAAITFEIGGDQALDAVIVVTAPAKVRLQRVIARDGSSAAAVQARMDQQWPEEKKVARADFLIENYDNRFLMPQVLRIHKALVN